MDQEQINKLIHQLQTKSESKLEKLFASRLKAIEDKLSVMYIKYSQDDAVLTVTDLNHYNRIQQELALIARELSGDFQKVVNEITASTEKVYVEQYMRSSYIYTMTTGLMLPVSIPTMQEIEASLSQPIAYIKLPDRLEVIRNETIQRIVQTISEGIMSGEGYGKTAAKLMKDLNYSRHRALLIARTEMHRAQSTAGLETKKKFNEAGADIKTMWSSTKDSRTRETHRRLDGQLQDDKGMFHSNGCVGPAPGLLVGANSAEENIGCRCQTIYVVNGIVPTFMRVKNEETGKSEVVPFQSYDDWMRDKGA